MANTSKYLASPQSQTILGNIRSRSYGDIVIVIVERGSAVVVMIICTITSKIQFWRSQWRRETDRRRNTKHIKNKDAEDVTGKVTNRGNGKSTAAVVALIPGLYFPLLLLPSVSAVRHCTLRIVMQGSRSM